MLKLKFFTASKLPSQQPVRDDPFERGYDKGVKITAAVTLDLIDSGLQLHELRIKLKRIYDDATK